MVRAAGWALAQKETEPDAHFCTVALNTSILPKAATTQTMVRSKRTAALVRASWLNTKKMSASTLEGNIKPS